MKKAILHIGTEKTGTTSIQLYLFKNRALLARQGFLFPETCDYLSSRKLVVFAMRKPDPDLIVGLKFDAADIVGLQDWKERFVADHCQEVIPFQSKHLSKSTVIYSSEHLQSRLKTVDEIKRVKSFLRPLYDQIKIVVYLRRQDRYAMSAHSTTLRAGRDSDFSFETVNAAGPYYDQLKLLEDWSEVFGHESVTARIFERSKLSQGDVVADLCEATGVPFCTDGMVAPEPQNEALSQTSQSLLRCYNRIADDDPRLAGIHRGQFRNFLLGKLEGVVDECGSCLPSRASAEKFMEHFSEANLQVSDRWLGGATFDNSLEMYPLEASTPAVIADADQQVDALVDEFKKSIRSRFF